MGNICASPNKLQDRGAAPDAHEAGAKEGEVYMLILALDYPGTGHELTCTDDGNNMADLADQSGISKENIVMLTNNECNYANVEAHIKEVAGRCQPGDYFVFNYSGHGANVPDEDGDEKDGQDEALCLVTEEGELDFSKFMTDDNFAEIVADSCEDGVKILIMCDCCHSGTIGDFSNPVWVGKEAVSMSGCRDNQTSGDTGQGGIWTHSLLLAIQQMQSNGNDDYSCAQLYNQQLEKDDETFNSAQDIQVHWTADLGGPERMAWPFVPSQPYLSPWARDHDSQR
jgi:hypothetical protein